MAFPWVALVGTAVTIGGAVATWEYIERERSKPARAPKTKDEEEPEGPIVAAPGSVIVGNLEAIPVEPGDGPTTPAPATYVGPVVDVAAEFSPVWIESARGDFLEWGACFIDWHEDARKYLSDDEATQKYINTVGTLVDWTLDLAVVIKWLLDRALCFRLDLSAIRIELRYIETGEELTLWGPTMPAGLPNGTQTSAATSGPWKGYTSVTGWNPSTSRVGFGARYSRWPDDWPPPSPYIGAGWLRNLGDKFGVGHDVYQLLSASGGMERSWPLMSLAGWRAVLRHGRPDTGLPYGVPEIFEEWKAPGQTGIARSWATRTKATNRFK